MEAKEIDIATEIRHVTKILDEYEKFKLMVSEGRLDPKSHQLVQRADVVGKMLKSSHLSDVAVAYMWARLELIEMPDKSSTKEKIYSLLSQNGVPEIAQRFSPEVTPVSEVKNSPRYSPRGLLNKVLGMMNPRGRKQESDPEISPVSSSRESSPRNQG